MGTPPHELPDAISVLHVLGQAGEHRIFYMPGAEFFPDRHSENSLRLSISNHTPESVAEGLRRPATALSDAPSALAAARR